MPFCLKFFALSTINQRENQAIKLADHTHHADRFGNLFRAMIRGTLKDEGIFEETQALAIKEVVVSHLTEAMEKQSLSKASLATLLKTNRSQVDRHCSIQPAT